MGDPMASYIAYLKIEVIRLHSQQKLLAVRDIRGAACKLDALLRQMSDIVVVGGRDQLPNENF